MWTYCSQKQQPTDDRRVGREAGRLGGKRGEEEKETVLPPPVWNSDGTEQRFFPIESVILRKVLFLRYVFITQFFRELKKTLFFLKS